MKRWWLVIALLLSVGLNLGILAAIGARRARPSGPRDPQGPEMASPANNPLPRLPRLADRLGLEGEERRKFLDIQWNLFQETSRLRLRVGEVHRDLRRELTRREPDRRRVDALLAESARIYGALERALVNNVLSTRDLLGPEKEREYLELVGRLRVPGPGAAAGFGGPGPRDRRLRDRFQKRPPGRHPPFEEDGRPEE
jgi:hypothetical protein